VMSDVRSEDIWTLRFENGTPHVGRYGLREYEL